MKSDEISVIIPCYNGGRFIFENISKIDRYLQEKFLDYEIIVVNDGSFDDTRKEVLRGKNSFPKLVFVDNETNSGKGHAVKCGMMKSRFDTVMFLDADLAIPIEELEKFTSEIKNGFELVVASRFVPGLKVVEPVLWYRKIMEKIFRLIRIFIIGNGKIRDTQCGFKVFSREAAMNVFPLVTIDRFAFDAEVIFVASKKGYKIKELPIALQNPTKSSIRIFYDSMNMVLDLLKIRVNSVLGKYEKRLEKREK